MGNLADDILKWIAHDFDDADQAAVVDLLAAYDGPEPDRVRRCVLHLAGGSVDALLTSLHTATMDYRDAIYCAEYDRDDRRLRDFTQPRSETRAS